VKKEVFHFLWEVYRHLRPRIEGSKIRSPKTSVLLLHSHEPRSQLSLCLCHKSSTEFLCLGILARHQRQLFCRDVHPPERIDRILSRACNVDREVDGEAFPFVVVQSANFGKIVCHICHIFSKSSSGAGEISDVMLDWPWLYLALSPLSHLEE